MQVPVLFCRLGDRVYDVATVSGMIHQRKSAGVPIVLAKTRNFIEEVKTELGKVTWPTRKETIATTWVVVVIIFLISLYLGACDVVLAKLMKLILV